VEDKESGPVSLKVASKDQTTEVFIMKSWKKVVGAVCMTTLVAAAAGAWGGAVPGDPPAAMPYRAMTNIIEFIKMLDMVVPGFAANETLLYSPELKFYSNKVKMDENLDTNIQGLHCLGDSSGWTRGLMMASVMGVLMGRKLAEKEGC